MKDKKRAVIVILAAFLLGIPLATAQSFPNPLGCFTTGSWGDIECIIGAGFMSLFGDPITGTIIALIMGIAFAYYLKMPLDMAAIFIFTFTWLGTKAFMPEWIYWMMSILLGSVTGWGFYKWLKSR